MPLYEITHSYPLNSTQKSAIAQKITQIHSSSFGTPSLFVNVQFTGQDASAGNYFVGGKAKLSTANRIQGMLRTGEKRTKADFDRVAKKIEDAWYDVVNSDGVGGGDKNGATEDKRNGEVKKDGGNEAKKLMFVTIYPMLTAREAGTAIPVAGEEKAWFSEYKPYFQKRADAGDQDFADMLKEVEEREDLRAALT